MLHNDKTSLTNYSHFEYVYSVDTKGLVTNYGERGATKREGGHVEFYPYEKGGRKKFEPC